MSAFMLPSQSLGLSQLAQNDAAIMPPWWSWGWDNQLSVREDFRDAFLWPRPRSMGSADAVTMGSSGHDGGRWGVQPWDFGGSANRVKIIGTTRDSSGVALGNCIVQGFTTSDDAFQGEMTSDPAGYFEFCTAMTGAHYLVCYKAGSPDVAGTSKNDLVGV